MKSACVLLLSTVSMLAPGAAVLAQQVDLSGHVRVLEGEHGKASSHDENVVVWLSPLDSPAPPRPIRNGRPRLTQHNKSFEPHLLVVPVGAVVEFPNRDPFFHNVFSLFDGKRFDLGLYEAGTTRNVSFDRPGVSYIFCNIHAEMSAVIIALDTPFYGISNSKGEVDISEVPAGRYLRRVWYEAALPATLNTLTREIRVGAEQQSLGNLEIPASLTVHSHQNKYGMDYEPPSSNNPGYEGR
ncbi:MAG: hypothetical protein JO356_18955 [Acidobacteria bacterium]|nr:hypothetical protein [Acidobacteriota bacterium]